MKNKIEEVVKKGTVRHTGTVFELTVFFDSEQAVGYKCYGYDMRPCKKKQIFFGITQEEVVAQAKSYLKGETIL